MPVHLLRDRQRNSGTGQPGAGFLEILSTTPRADRHLLAPDDIVGGYFGEGPARADGRTMLLPGGPRIYVLRGDPSLSRLAIRRRAFAPLPPVGFIGPTTRVACLDHGAARLSGVRLRSTAWAALFDGDLSRYTDRVVPLAAIERSPLPDLAEDAVATFAPWLAARLAEGPGPDRQAQRIIELIDAGPRSTVAWIATSLRLTPPRMSATCLENFGLPPKRLLMQRRFVRVLRRLLADPTATGRALWEAGYVDHSHFARDCRQFLGSSLQTFRDLTDRRDDLA
jgi:AraC-like DNA-binding protein